MSDYPVPTTSQITRPQTNPVVFGLLNLLLGGVGYLYVGQIKKGILSILICTVGGCASMGLGYLFVLATAYDAYLLGLKLQSGQPIGKNENALEFLDGLFKD